MKPNEEVFIFESYFIQSNKKEIQFNYKYKDSNFIEKIFLPEQIPSSVNPVLLTKVLENLHLILGISYYKMHCSKKIAIPYPLTHEQAQFWNTVYTKGLGEFFYKNKIDFRKLINFPHVNKLAVQLDQLDEAKKNRFLVGIGGGKDSVVAVELLKREKKPIVGFILDSQKSQPTIQMEVVNKMEIDYLVVRRELDDQLFQIKSIYNGHIPITAIYSFVGLLLAVVYDFSTIIIPNGKSADFGNVNYLGTEINHQWSKSEEFENLFQNYVKQYITPNVTYFSNLRSYSEIEIAKMFSFLKKYFSVFSSCNRNFTVKGNNTQKKWCGKCAKCSFVFIILAAHIPKKEVIKIFDKNLLNDAELISLYQDLTGKGKMKPFDCVGTFEESREALKLIRIKGEFNNDKVIKSI